MRELYSRLLPRCRTANQVNRLHISLENRMTPLEFEELRHAYSPPSQWRVVARRFIDTRQHSLAEMLGMSRPLTAISPASRLWAARVWIQDLGSKVALSGKSRAESFSRSRLRRDVFRYGAGGARDGKTLLICFTGNSKRMMMPLPVFLQHLDAGRMDVAVLRDPQRSGYRKGFGGMGDTLEGCVDALPDLLAMGDYRSVVSIGTSGGGLPAVLAALRLGLDATMSVGGNGPDDPRWVGADGTGARELIEAYRSARNAEPRIFLLYGAEKSRDQPAAEALASVLPVHLMPISDPRKAVGHNAFFPLVRQKRFADLLEQTLFSRS